MPGQLFGTTTATEHTQDYTLLASYPPAPDQQAARLSIHALGIDHVRSGILRSRHGLGDWVVIWFHDQTHVLTRQGLQRLPPEQLVIWPPYTPKQYGDRDRSHTHTWLRCHGRLLTTWLEEAAVPTAMPISVREPELLRQWWWLLHAECASPTRQHRVISELMLALFHRIGAWHHLDLPAANDDQLLTVKEWLDSHFHESCSLPDLARRAGLSRAHFATRFRLAYGSPPMRYIRQLRMQHAAHLLVDHSLQIRQIAQRCGFPDPFQFTRAFRRHYGCSPSTWRKWFV